MGDSRRVQVLVVDGNRDVRQRVRETLARTEQLEVMADAADAFEARLRLRANRPDVVLLGFALPTLDGLTFLKHLLRMDPRPVVMLAREQDAQATVTALELGAVSHFLRPDDVFAPWNDSTLTSTLKSAAGKTVHVRSPSLPPAVVRAVSCDGGPATHFLSMGPMDDLGALVENVRALPPGSAAVVKTDLEGAFARALVERLDEVASVDVRLAREDVRLDEGRLWVVPADLPLEVVKRGSCLALRRTAQSTDVFSGGLRPSRAIA